MSGIYIHIPFCKQVCYYCDFHFSVSLKLKSRLIENLNKELIQRKDYLKNQNVETIYFGGGSPSVLDKDEIKRLLKTIQDNYKVVSQPEITFEANPDDLTREYIQDLRENQVNRLSIGIQSFEDVDLKLMNRRHTALEAENCIKLCKEAGFSNINIDLMYGIPGMSLETWEKNLKTAFSLGVQHLSAYHLIIEPQTVFGYYLRKKSLFPVDENTSVEQYRILLRETLKQGYIHYEISNFALEGCFSKHNCNYWNGTTYLGIGPSAHSFNGISRQWNCANNSRYIEGMEKGFKISEKEILDEKAKFNDYMLTSLRTMWGADLDYIGRHFGQNTVDYCLKTAEKFGSSIVKTDNKLILTDEAKFISDGIICEFIEI